MSEPIDQERSSAFAACPNTGCDWGSFWQGWKARAAAQPASVAVPEGYALVPIEPTEQMVSAGSEAAHAGGCDLYRMKREVMNAWPAMLAASPHPVSGEHKPVAFTTAGMLEIAKDLPLTGRIGARCRSDERWNVALYTAPPAAQGVAGLVAALMSCAKASSAAEVGLIVDAALAAHREGVGGQL